MEITRRYLLKHLQSIVHQMVNEPIRLNYRQMWVDAEDGLELW